MNGKCECGKPSKYQHGIDICDECEREIDAKIKNEKLALAGHCSCGSGLMCLPEMNICDECRKKMNAEMEWNNRACTGRAIRTVIPAAMKARIAARDALDD